jgi:hypothetical protein
MTVAQILVRPNGEPPGLIRRPAGPPPRLDFAPRVSQRQEPVRVQAPVAQAAVERLDRRVVDRPARAQEIPRDVVLVGSAGECLRDELRLFIDLTHTSPVMPWSSSIAGASRMKAAPTVRAPNRRPSNRASQTKFLGQRSFGWRAAG